ncbi:CO dehydrogenase maturation factor [Acetoanaerobium noterae]|jgi:CO dehydrogenase maturation factor|uniref:Nickel insertase n=2 Tax=Acetoanaerobium TaxID=186831 RepID=E3PXX2_ACESD|nr:MULTISPECIES: AAA family ATPase [Acetoanaerobium]MBP8762806.1 AAA family ATPase [Acetoanaerobium sp.]MDK2803276.1 dehydrogenase maturation factor [Peptostreptococcaceae bacterium]MBP9561939.1 AAA family ATPase [Acetoanaerobium sp.]CBH21287.1 Nickel insertase [Acetoanaerobium sticklandii]SKB53145.1 CO dehydrogenase maturation factor [Acetoanaerobium noterae]
MGKTIAVAGKGGTGKTSLTGLLINYLATEKSGKVIAVDADANANLNEVLGEKIDITLGAIKEDVNRRERDGNSFPGGMTKAQYMKYRLSTAISEGDGYDLLVMGRSEGTGCYCYVNGILREQLDTISNSYDYLVIDNEAGMEHLSRGTSKSVDVLLLVSDCSRRSIQAVARIRDLALELKLKIGDLYLIVNKAPNGQLNDGIMEEINKYNLNLLGVVPMDDNIYEYDSNGKPLVDLPIDSPSKKTFHEILSNLNI